MDTGDLSFNPAVELSYLNENEQKLLLDAMSFTQAKPSLSQAQRIKKESQEGNLNGERIREILLEDKKRNSEKIILENQVLHEYFPYYYTTEMMQKKIIELLSNWKTRRDRKKGGNENV